MPLLSVIIPVYNEVGTIKEVLKKIDSLDIDKEIIVVDDGSCDGTQNLLNELKGNNLKIIHHATNRGKGAAFLTGLENASGDFIIIQDADLEYEPAEYFKLLDGFKDGETDLVLGARFTRNYYGLLIPRLGNRFLTILINLLFGTRLNDSLTCYKLGRRSTFKGLGLKSQSFNIEIEIVVKAIRNKLRIKQIPILYTPRSYREGKKIRWLDGIYAIITIIKYRFFYTFAARKSRSSE